MLPALVAGRIAPSGNVDLCAVGFAHHTTDYQGDTKIDSTMRWRILDNPWHTESDAVTCDGGSCEWESEPISYMASMSISVIMEATHEIDLHADNAPTTSVSWSYD